jgi:hypothetical protein
MRSMVVAALFVAGCSAGLEERGSVASGEDFATTQQELSGATQARVGVQAIGLANWDEGSARELGRIFRSAGGSLEVSFLPFDFNRGDAFQRARQVVDETLDGGSARLVVTTYLWFHDNAASKFRWSAFPSFGRNTGSAADFEREWRRRITGFNRFVKDARAIAAEHEASSRLVFVLCPILEDAQPDHATYERMLAVTADLVESGVRFRRSGILEAGRDGRERVTLDGRARPLELHGTIGENRRRLSPGDVFSNDGNFVWFDPATVEGSKETSRSYDDPITRQAGTTSMRDFLTFMRDQVRADERTSVLLWRPAYNGLDDFGRVDRFSRTPIRVFTGPGGNLEREGLRVLLRGRP